jgi:cyclopropane fatty-acyl-phospholipid synthase-like methyltransferase
MEASARHEYKDRALGNARFPHSNSYDPKWILDNQMGLNPLWLTERVCEKMPLAPGMHLLDLGCGKGLSNIFLVKEYDVQG